MVTQATYGDLLEPGLRRIFDNAVSRPAPMVDAMYGVQSSTKLEEHYTSMGELAPVPVFNGRVTYDNFDQGYRTDILNYELALGIQIPRAVIDDDQYNEIERRARRLGNTFANTREKDAAQTFINFFTDSGTNRLGASTNGADGVALGSTAHPYSPRNASTQANEGTLALSLANVDTTVQAMMNFVDDRGELLDVLPDMILIPRELKRAAAGIFDPRAIWEPGSAQFDANIFNGEIRVVVWNRLTDANAWFMIDSSQMREHLIWQNRIMPEFNEATDSDTFTRKFIGYMRYGIGFDDWRWVYGQNPS